MSSCPSMKWPHGNDHVRFCSSEMLMFWRSHPDPVPIFVCPTFTCVNSPRLYFVFSGTTTELPLAKDTPFGGLISIISLEASFPINCTYTLEWIPAPLLPDVSIYKWHDFRRNDGCCVCCKESPKCLEGKCSNLWHMTRTTLLSESTLPEMFQTRCCCWDTAASKQWKHFCGKEWGAFFTALIRAEFPLLSPTLLSDDYPFLAFPAWNHSTGNA